MRSRANYGGLDHFRMAAAILVIAIHTSPLTSFSDGADFFLTRVLARAAVPFFLMVTGQFVVSRFVFHKDTGAERMWQYVKKIAIVYGIAILIYIPIGIYAGHYKDLSLGAVLRMLVFDGTFYHLWYFPACIIGVLLVYGLSRFLNVPGMLIVTAFLYVIGLFGDSYYGVIENVSGISAAYEVGFHIFSYTRNGIFLAPLFLVLGACVGRVHASLNRTAQKKKKRVVRPTNCEMGLVISLCIMTAEAFALRHFGVQRHDSMYFALIPTMIFLYMAVLSWKRKPAKFVRNMTTWIYILHPAVIVIVRGAAGYLHLTKLLVENSLIHYIAVVAVTLVIAAIITGVLSVVKWMTVRREDKV